MSREHHWRHVVREHGNVSETHNWPVALGSLGPVIASKTEARAEADRIRDQIRAGTFGPQAASPAPVTLGQLLTVYFDDYMRLHRQASSSNEESSRNVILRTELPTADGRLLAFRDWPITDITAATLERFKAVRLAAGQGRGKVAINRNLTLLRACFNWAIHPSGYLTATPFKHTTARHRAWSQASR